MSELSQRVETVVVAASEGSLTIGKLRAANGSLIEAGLDSVQILAVIMGLESEFGVVIDVNEDASFLLNTAIITAFIETQLKPEDAR